MVVLQQISRMDIDAPWTFGLWFEWISRVAEPRISLLFRFEPVKEDA